MEESILSSPQKSKLIKSLPSTIRSCVEDDGWQILLHRNTSSCIIMTEEEFLNEYAKNGFCQTYEEIESNMSPHLNRFGLDHDDPIRAKSSADGMLGDNNDESSTYSVDDRDFLQVPGLPRIEENIHSQQVPE